MDRVEGGREGVRVTSERRNASQGEKEADGRERL